MPVSQMNWYSKARCCQKAPWCNWRASHAINTNDMDQFLRPHWGGMLPAETKLCDPNPSSWGAEKHRGRMLIRPLRL